MRKFFNYNDPQLANKILNSTLFNIIPPDKMKIMLEKSFMVNINKDEYLFRKGDTYHKGLYYVIDGSISLLSGKSDDVILNEGDVAGLTTFVGKSEYAVSALAIEDSSLIYLPEICIYKLMADHENFRRKFYEVTMERLNQTNQDSTLSLSSNTYKSVGTYMTSPVIKIKNDDSVIKASRIMSEHEIGALVVVDKNSCLYGLITSKHIVHRFVSAIKENGMDLNVEHIMETAPPQIPKEYPLIEALGEMQNGNTEYAVIIENKIPIGIISSKDIMKIIFQSSTAMNFHISQVDSLEELRNTKKYLFKTAKDLVNHSRLTCEALSTLSSLHISIQRQVHRITANEYYKRTGFNINDVDHCLVIMGSGARKEMMLDPDQDNGFIFNNNITEDETAHLMDFGADFTENLDFVGYEKCKGNIMVTNPQMSKTLDRWKEDIYELIHNPGGEGLVLSSIIFDMEGFTGNDSLVWEMKKYISEQVSDNDIFLLQLFAKEAGSSVPLSLFGNFVTLNEPDKKGLMDLKSSAISLIVFVARINTLKAGLNDTNTNDRLKHLKRIKVFSEDTVDDILSSYETITDITFREQLRKAENFEPLNKLVNPSELSLHNQHELKNALNDISKFVNIARKKFRGNIR